MEHLNKCTKGQGGICGIRSHPKTLLKFCLAGPELARLAEEAERLTAVSSSGVVAQQHHCISQAKVRRQEQAIAKLKKVLMRGSLAVCCMVNYYLDRDQLGGRSYATLITLSRCSGNATFLNPTLRTLQLTENHGDIRVLLD